MRARRRPCGRTGAPRVSMSSSTTAADWGRAAGRRPRPGPRARSKSWHGATASSSTTSLYRSVSNTAKPQFSLTATARGTGGSPPIAPRSDRPSLCGSSGRRRSRGGWPARRDAPPASRPPGGATPGRPDDQRDAHRRFVQHALGHQPVAAGHLSVVTRVHDPRGVQEALALERIDHAADRVVDDRYVGGIGADACRGWRRRSSSRSPRPRGTS